VEAAHNVHYYARQGTGAVILLLEKAAEPNCSSLPGLFNKVGMDEQSETRATPRISLAHERCREVGRVSRGETTTKLRWEEWFLV